MDQTVIRTHLAFEASIWEDEVEEGSMLESIMTFLESASFLAVFNQISAMSITEVVTIFLVSKPLFIVAALFFLCVPQARNRVSGYLEGASTDPLRLMPDDEPKLLVE